MRRRWTILVGGAALWFLGMNPALASGPTVERVAVFPRGAEVSFLLAPGSFDVALPGAFVPESVRLESSPGMPLPPQPTVTVEPRPGWVPPALQPLADRVEAFRRDALAAEAERDAFVEVLKKIDLFVPEGEKALEQIQALEPLRKEYALRRGDGEKRAEESRRRYDAWKQELASKLPPGDTVLRICGVVPGKQPLRLVAWTDQAEWSLRYRLELDTATGRMAGSLRASIRNISGIDWQGTGSLHTAQPPHSTMPPHVVPLVATVREKGAEDRVMFQSKTTMPAPAPMAPADYAVTVGAPRRMESVQDVAFSVGEIAASGDGLLRDLPLETFSLQGTVALVAVPAYQAEAWILAEVASVDRAFLAGPCELVADGTPSGNTTMPDRGAGQPLSLAFGSSPLVRAERISRVGSEGTGWLGGGRKEDGYTIRISNGLPSRRIVRVLDRIPISAHESVAVEDLHLEPAPIKNEEGVLTWELPVEPGGWVDIAVSWKMSFPGDKDLVLQDKP